MKRLGFLFIINFFVLTLRQFSIKWLRVYFPIVEFNDHLEIDCIEIFLTFLSLLVANVVHVVPPVAEVIFDVAHVHGHVSLVLSVCVKRSVIEGN
jgi:hypothetical protein